MSKLKLLITNYQLLRSDGYAAMFSFLVMMTVLGILMSVFAILFSKSIFLSRTSLAEFKNTYAAEGFIEDALRRGRDADLADTLNGEALAVGDSTVTVSLSSEDTVKNYFFSAEIGGKYFGNEVLVIDGAGAPAKIKKWQDSP